MCVFCYEVCGVFDDARAKKIRCLSSSTPRQHGRAIFSISKCFGETWAPPVKYQVWGWLQSRATAHANAHLFLRSHAAFFITIKVETTKKMETFFAFKEYAYEAKLYNDFSGIIKLAPQSQSFINCMDTTWNFFYDQLTRAIWNS